MVSDSFLQQLTINAEDDGIQQLVVGALVRHDNAVLLLQRSEDDFMGGIFELPSGKVEAGETLDTALTREVTEETGLNVSAIHDYLGHFDYESGSGKKSRQFNFVVSIRSPEPVHLSEHDAYLWGKLGEELPVSDAVKSVLAEYRQLVFR